MNSQTITIAEKSFEVTPRYAEGHTLTANEASALNQTYFENLRNNFAKKAKDGGTQADLDAYAASYKFGERTGGGSRDPIEAEAMNLARDAIKRSITAKGGKISDYTAAAISNAAAKLVDSKPEYREKAKERVEQAKAIAGDSISDDLLESLKADSAKEEPTDGSAAGEPAAAEGFDDAPASRKRKAGAE